MVDNKVIRTRIAPSPTGEYHIGHLRTCLYDYALAKQKNGHFIIRIEDTDQKRFVPGSMERTLQVIKDYGLNWDEGPDIGGPYAPYIQTKRLDIYQEHIKKLIDKGLAYYCFCTPERLETLRSTQKKNHQAPRYDQHCLSLSKEEIKKNLDNKIPYTIRMAIPKNETIIFNDIIRGKIKFNTNDIDDQVLIKSSGIPTYHFAAVVDDHLMNITHVFRGEEWLTSTPKHLLLYRYFDWEPPIFTHLTVLLNPDGKGKLSKRHGATSARSFLEEGYLPEAMLNFLMFLGWNPGDDREFFTLDEFVKEFSLDHLHKKSPVFDRKKLDYINGCYIRKQSESKLLELIKPFVKKIDDKTLKQFIPLLKERIYTLQQAADLTNFIHQDIDYSVDLFTEKKLDLKLVKEILTNIKKLLSNQKEWTFEDLQEKLLSLKDKNDYHTGKFFMALRITVCASPFTLPIVESISILGQQKTIEKIDIALKKIS